MKKIYLFLILIFLCRTVFSTESDMQGDSGPYIGLNVFASFSEIDNKVSGILIPLFSNLETGIALNGGYNFKNGHSTEARLSIGKANDMYSAFQFHLGYKYFVLDEIDISNKGFYIGSFIKYINLNNVKTDINYYNVIPYLATGYQFDFNNFFIDIRLNQTIYAISWSDRAYTSVGNEFKFSSWEDISPVIPYLSTNIGYSF